MPTWSFPCSRVPEPKNCGALTWSRVNLDGNPPTIELWRSVRAHGDTKTSKSRRTLELTRKHPPEPDPSSRDDARRSKQTHPPPVVGGERPKPRR